jgi:DNA-binding NtrC family response regulator
MSAQPSESRHILVGQSPRTRQVIRLIEKLGKCRWPALLLGETGTGKEVVARSVHNVKASGPFVTVDCSFMESELFGHVKGAFTGAANNKFGLLEAANGGTAFFDEIGELALDLQAKLLRVLQEKEFRPVGSVATRHSDFRIIAATNRDLAAEVEKGTFRRDLYFRLNVVNIRLSPLRERREDIPALINHFLSRVGGNYGVTAEALEVMLSYDWPGNVRELENCVQHMAAVNSGPLLHTADLPSNLQNHLIQKKAQYLMAAVGRESVLGPASLLAANLPGAPALDAYQPALLSAPSPMPEPAPSIVPLHVLERRAILNALEYTKGDRAIAAHLLGIGRTTLYRKLKEYQLAT